jgi:hypothetical protein
VGVRAVALADSDSDSDSDWELDLESVSGESSSSCGDGSLSSDGGGSREIVGGEYEVPSPVHTASVFVPAPLGFHLLLLRHVSLQRAITGGRSRSRLQYSLL